MNPELPVAVAQDIAERHCCRQVIVVAWDGTINHCVTFGISVQDSDQAAQGGDRIKTALGWPSDTIGNFPARVQAIQQELEATRLKLEEAELRLELERQRYQELAEAAEHAARELERFDARDSDFLEEFEEAGWQRAQEIQGMIAKHEAAHD